MESGPPSVGLRRAVFSAWIVTQRDVGIVPKYLWHIQAIKAKGRNNNSVWFRVLEWVKRWKERIEAACGVKSLWLSAAAKRSPVQWQRGCTQNFERRLAAQNFRELSLSEKIRLNCMYFLCRYLNQNVKFTQSTKKLQSNCYLWQIEIEKIWRVDQFDVPVITELEHIWLFEYFYNILKEEMCDCKLQNSEIKGPCDHIIL